MSVSAALGFVVAALPQGAAADGLLPTTIQLPTLPVTLPTISLPGATSTTTPATTTSPDATTTTTSTTAPAAAAAAAQPAIATAAAAETPAAVRVAGATAIADAAGVRAASTAGGTDVRTALAGAMRLSNGSISIPVASVRSPNRIVLQVSTARSLVAGKPLKASIQVRDTRGYLVRGAAVAIRSVPAKMLPPVARKRNATDGRTSFAVRTTTKTLRGSSLLRLVVTANDPARPETILSSRSLRLPIAALGR